MAEKSDVYAPEIPECEGERCYNFLGMQNDVNAREAFKRAAEAGEAQARKCVACQGRRCNAVNLDCWSYIANISGKYLIIRKYDLGFVSSKELSDARIASIQREKNKAELKALRQLKPCLGEGGVKRIEQLEKILGGENE